MHVYIVRHGQTAWNIEERAQGHTDIPLDELGRRQAEATADLLSDQPIAKILTSDLVRSLETANVVARRVAAPVETNTLLRERFFGQWEGKTKLEIKPTSTSAENLYDVLLELEASGIETLQEAWNRFGNVADQLRLTESNTLVVSHGGTCPLLLCQLIGAPLAAVGAFRFPNCCVAELRKLKTGQFRLVRFNCGSGE